MAFREERQDNIAHLMAGHQATGSGEPPLTMEQPPSNSIVLAFSSSSQAARQAECHARKQGLDEKYGKFLKRMVSVFCRRSRSRSRSRSPSRRDPGFGGLGTHWVPGLRQYLPGAILVPNPADRVYVLMLNGETVELKNASANDPMDDLSYKLGEASGMTREELDDTVLVQLWQGPEVPGPKILELIMLPKDALVLQPGSVSIFVDASDSGWLDYSGKKHWDKFMAFHLWSSHKISTLKDMCMSKTGKRVDNLCFKFEGKQLNDASTLEACKIQTGCILHLVRLEAREVVVQTIDGQDVTLRVNHELVSNLDTIDFGIWGNHSATRNDRFCLSLSIVHCGMLGSISQTSNIFEFHVWWGYYNFKC